MSTATHIGTAVPFSSTTTTGGAEVTPATVQSAISADQAGAQTALGLGPLATATLTEAQSLVSEPRTQQRRFLRNSGPTNVLSLPGAACRSWAAALTPQTTLPNYSWQVRAELPVLPSKLAAVRFAVLSHPTVAQAFVAVVGSPAQWTGKNLTGGGSWQFAGWDGSDHTTSAPVTVPSKAQRHSDWVWTDWCTINASARTDGGTHAIVVARLYQQSGSAVQCVGNASADTPMTTLSGSKLKYVTDYQSGDFVTANRDTFAGATNPGCSPIVAIEYMTNDGVVTYSVAEFGDSIASGYATSVRGNGPVCDAVAAINAAGTYRSSPIMQGWAGDQVESYYRRFEMMCKSGKGLPLICIFRPYTRNNGGNLQKVFPFMAAFADTCRRYGIIPVLATGMYESATPSNNTTMLSANTQIRAFGTARDIDVIELEDLWTASTPLADGIHPSDTEQALMVPRYVAGITAAIQRTL